VALALFVLRPLRARQLTAQNQFAGIRRPS
jgi:hypothetical protein